MGGDMTPEGLVKKEILRELEKLDAYIFMPVQYGYGQRTLDILCCIKGRFVAIECKRADGSGKLTRIQSATIERIVAAGGHAIVACSSAFVIEYLKENNII